MAALVSIGKGEAGPWGEVYSMDGRESGGLYVETGGKVELID